MLTVKHISSQDLRCRGLRSFDTTLSSNRGNGAQPARELECPASYPAVDSGPPAVAEGRTWLAFRLRSPP